MRTTARIWVTPAALGALLAAGFTAGCDLQRAVDCARLALEVSSGAVALEQAVQSGDAAAFDEAADTMAQDIDELRGDVDSTDVREAADSVTEAVDSIRSGFENGTDVDLSPLGDATDELTDVCA